jgi:phosphohistidine swiveling domain-containing protein
MSGAFTHRLEELNASCVALAGGKGASLGELTRCGVPVPRGFVVASDAFTAFLEATGRRRQVESVIERLDAGALRLDAATAEIAALLAAAPVPGEVVADIERAAGELGAPSVSVRSSATCEDGGACAWAGQLETYLNVPPRLIVARVRDCWLSLFTPRALAYGAAHGYGAASFSVAVVVQEMVASEVSGIAFSVHPVTQEPNILLIEACLGLGEAIVSGQVIPDQYVVERGSRAILERAVGCQRQGLFADAAAPGPAWRELGEAGSRPKLSDEQVRRYAAIVESIQDHYGYPVDTEWALAEGEFRVLQARPITTLAEEYAESIIDPGDDWHPLVRRPMSLLEASIWSHWSDSRHAEKRMGIEADRALSIQDDAGLANDFITTAAMQAGQQHVAEMFRRDRRAMIELLERGHAIYDRAQARLERGAGFGDLDAAVDFFCDVAQHTTVFPAWVLWAYEREGIDDAQVRSLAEGLRAHTLYPAIERKIIDPMAADMTRAAGFTAPEQAAEVTTWSELRGGPVDRDLLEWRLAAVRAGRRFVFQSIDGDDQVRFVSQSGYLLMRLARQRQLAPRDDATELAGQAAWPGVCRARARVVLAPDEVGQSIEEGEVLVSIQSSPALMPLLRHCGAIVTDDGGIACHAAIIARELRKPTLIGTGRATSTIRTGDLVEVDAYAQVVRILERAPA